MPYDLKDAFDLNPPLGFRFSVVFLVGGALPNPLDIRFSKVSGLDINIETTTHNEGGQNLYSHRLPQKMTYQNLVLERSMAIGSILVAEFNTAMSLFKFNPGNALVMLLNESGIPLASWLFFKTYPVKWQVANFDAEQNSVVIETMELSYTRMQAIRI
jgi:phage tail-like protein